MVRQGWDRILELSIWGTRKVRRDCGCFSASLVFQVFTLISESWLLWVRLIRHMFHLASSIWDTNSLNSHWTVILHPPAQARAVKWVPSCWVSASPAKFFFSFPSPLNEFGIFVLTFLQQSPRAPGLQTLLELDSHHWPALLSVSSHYKFFCLIPCACFSDRWLPMATGCRLWTFSRSPAYSAATGGSCLETGSGFYCCCSCYTLSAHSYKLTIAAVLSQTMHRQCSPLRCTMYQQPASYITDIRRFGETIGNSYRQELVFKKERGFSHVKIRVTLMEGVRSLYD